MTPISEQQQELLSAALDGQLSAAEQAQLDQQLEYDHGLAAEFDELRSIQALLQELPPVRPPRSFTLDPAIHAPKRSFWLGGWMRWVGVVGAFALMLTVGLQLTNQTEQSMTMAPVADSINPQAANGVSEHMATENDAITAEAPPMGAGSDSGPADPDQPTTADAEDMARMHPMVGGAAPAMIEGYPTPMAYSSIPISDTADMARMSAEQATAMAGSPLNNPLLEQNDTSSPDTLDLEQPELKQPPVVQPVSVTIAEPEPSLLLWFSIALVLGVGLAAAMVYWLKNFKQP
ncbi:hypothetical protein [Herpetosiphon gulosus]|uniref:Transmembrane anti-sigma factor n=1 Tax=Herpetosiphon gulosus TaxID=1973496 RepID=A0ABP9X293_9CHLR